MNKSFIYTILTLFLALVFVFGSMAGMNYILEVRERQILTESGKAVMEAPVRAWQKQEGSGDSLEETKKQDDGGDSLGETKEQENGENSNQGKYVLTAKQMEEVISYWNNRMTVTVHNPVNGQISMEEAVKAGEEWLMEMGMVKSGQEKDMGTYSVTATLGVAMQKETAGVQLEPYYSFWTVQFSNQSVSAVLYLNAVTGKVWGAEVALFEGFPEEMPYEKLKFFVELSGLLADEADIVKNQEGTKAVLQTDGSQIWAEMEFWHSQAGQSDFGYAGAGLGDFRKNVIMSFQLTVGQNP